MWLEQWVCDYYKNEFVVMSIFNIVIKLFKVGIIIFIVMFVLVSEKGVVNLGQGFFDFYCDLVLVDVVICVMQDGLNQYLFMVGVLLLCEVIVDKVEWFYGYCYDLVFEIMVMVGVIQGILILVLCVVYLGDEVIVIELVYDCYVLVIELVGGVLVFVQMEVGVVGYSIFWDKVCVVVMFKICMIMVNILYNLIGSVMCVFDVVVLVDIVCGIDILIFFDEVYEYMVFDGQLYELLVCYLELVECSFINFSFGKIYYVIGWKVGYVVVFVVLIVEFCKVYQFNVFIVNMLVQYGLVEYMKNLVLYLDLLVFYQRKCDFFCVGLVNIWFELLFL